MMETYKPFMPSFAMIQEHDEIRGESWAVDILKDRTKGMAARGTLRVEDSVRKEHAEKKIGANKTGATGCGVNDYSSHAYEEDAYWEEDELSTHILRKNISSPEKDQWRQARARAWVSGTN
jgi:hypothetical protein